MIVTCQLVASSCYVSTSMTGIIQQYQALYVCSPPPQPLQGHDLDFDRCSQSASKQIDWTEYTSCELDDGCPVAAHFGCNKARENTLKASVQTCFSMRNSRHTSSSCQLMWGQKSLSSLRHLARRILQAKEPWWPGFWPSKSCEYRNVGFNQNKKTKITSTWVQRPVLHIYEGSTGIETHLKSSNEWRSIPNPVFSQQVWKKLPFSLHFSFHGQTLQRSLCEPLMNLGPTSKRKNSEVAWQAAWAQHAPQWSALDKPPWNLRKRTVVFIGHYRTICFYMLLYAVSIN